MLVASRPVLADQPLAVQLGVRAGAAVGAHPVRERPAVRALPVRGELHQALRTDLDEVAALQQAVARLARPLAHARPPADADLQPGQTKSPDNLAVLQFSPVRG